MISRSSAIDYTSTILMVATLVLIAACSGKSGSGEVAATPSYYIDASNGSDSNSGTQSSSPWKTLNKISTSTFSSGAILYLKRGETWYEELDIPSSGVSVDAYGSGALPVIDGSIEVGSGTWSAVTANIYTTTVALATGEGLGNVSENGSMLTFASWNTGCTTTLASAANGSYTYGYPATLCIKVSSNPGSNGLSYRASKRFFGVSAVGKANISIKNIQVQRFSLNGINYKNCETCTASAVTVRQGGGAVISGSPLLYAGNGIECDNACTNILIDNVTVSDIFDSGISPQTYISNQSASNITIQNSTVDKAGFAGVEISVLSNGGSTGSSISNVTLSGLTITGSGQGWSGRRYGTEGHGIRMVADNGAGTMSNLLVQGTSVSGSVGDGIKLGGEVGTVTINRAKVKGNNMGINVADAAATSLKLVLTTSLIYANNSYGVNFDVPLGAGFNLYHNTFYDNTTINFAIFHQAGQARLQNNLFSNSAAMAHVYVATVLLNGVINNNCYSNQPTMPMFGYNSNAYTSVSGFATATTFEANGIGGASIDFVNAAAENFSLQSTSQCRNLGISGLGVTQDYAQHNYDTTHPSSGAYQ